MYETYWQLDQKPFENAAGADFYYPAEPHQGALLKLRYAIEGRRSAALLCGAAGLGKTLLLQQIRGFLAEEYSPFVHLVFPQMPPEQLLAYLATELGASEGHVAAPSIESSIRSIEKFLHENAQQDRHAVVAIDEAHLLDQHETLEALRLLLNIEHEGTPTFTLLLTGQASLLPMLDRRGDLEQRLDVKCLLRLLNLEETASYVNHRLTAAGAQRAIFTDDALEALFHLTHGTPRKINRLCDLALLIGFAEELPSIGATQIEEVSDELVNVAPE